MLLLCSPREGKLSHNAIPCGGAVYWLEPVGGAARKVSGVGSPPLPFINDVGSMVLASRAVGGQKRRRRPEQFPADSQSLQARFLLAYKLAPVACVDPFITK